MAPCRNDEPQTLGDVLARMKALPSPPPGTSDADQARRQNHNDALAQLQTSALVARALAQDAVTRGGSVPNSLIPLVPGGLLRQLTEAPVSGGGDPWIEQPPINSSDDATAPVAGQQTSGNTNTIPSDGTMSSPDGTAQSNAATAFGPHLDLLGKIWASPYTALGLAYGGLGHLYGLATGKHPQISFGNNAVQFIDNPFVNKRSAFTLGNTILYGRESPPTRNYAYGDPNVNTGRHEQAHTYQYQALGPLFAPAYMLAGGFPDPGSETGRLGNPFEDAAQRYGSGQGSWWPW